MTKEQKALLAPHAEHFMAMAMYVRESSDEELAELIAACAAASGMNCGWDTYAAAQSIGREALLEQGVRQRRAKEASLGEQAPKEEGK